LETTIWPLAGPWMEGWNAPAYGEDDTSRAGRRVCARCLRPAAQDCLCSALPPDLLDTRGCVVVLQHPHEARRTLASVPLLAASLRKLRVVRSRGFKPGRDALLDAVLAAARRETDPLPLFLLWPAEAVDVAEAAKRLATSTASVALSASDDTLFRCAYVLLVLDGTWTQCTEMARPLLAELCPPAVVVHLSAWTNAPDCLLRSEPAPGCVVTAEAVARALEALEARATGDADAAEALREQLLKPLRMLVCLQRRHDALGKGVKERR